MAKKKDKPQVINNIQELNLEIDYDKLAEAIVKAINAKDASSEEMQTKPKVGIINFFRVVYYIVFNRRKTNGTMTSTLMGGMLSFAFKICFSPPSMEYQSCVGAPALQVYKTVNMESLESSIFPARSIMFPE